MEKWERQLGVTEEAIERLTTKETYFFRQEYQLRAFRDQLLPQIAQANATRRRLAVWSAGCSTGEEAYTLAILILESGLFRNWDVKVVGSDICRGSVAAARRGIYREAAFRTTSHELRSQYFANVGEGAEVAPELKKICHFGQLNLMDSGRAVMVGQVDVIFCRNVLIYFDMKSRRRVIDGFYDRLVPGGYLLLGHSESLLNVSTAFELVHLREDLVYRKPLGAWPKLLRGASAAQFSIVIVIPFQARIATGKPLPFNGNGNFRLTRTASFG